MKELKDLQVGDEVLVIGRSCRRVSKIDKVTNQWCIIYECITVLKFKVKYMRRKLEMIWRILCDKQVVVITEDHGRMYYNWDARSLEDVCQMCSKVHDMALVMDNKK